MSKTNKTLIKKIVKLKKIIIKKIISKKISKLYLKFLMTEVLKINLVIENIILDKTNKNGSPYKIFIKILNNFLVFLNQLNFIDNFNNKIFIKYNKKKIDKKHEALFQNLWTKYDVKNYKINRLDRYIFRIELNNLQNKIFDKKIIDFGCGHGNFLLACSFFGPKKCVGIDYGENSIKFAKKIVKKFNTNDTKFNFYKKSIYKNNLKDEYFDFAIKNGVFHHLANEKKALKQVHRVLKKNGYFWYYGNGGGGIRNMFFDMCYEIFKDIDQNEVVDFIEKLGFNSNKIYHLSDGILAKYKYTSFNEIVKKLKKSGFYNFKQLKGGFNTDFDKPYYKDKYFFEKFGHGDLRIICQKK